jgi:ribonuclease G
VASALLTADLFVSPGPGEWRAAWIEGGAARELYVERGDTKPPGSRHLGRVVRVVPALDAALVDIGDERPGFLPLRDVPEGGKAEEGARLAVEVRREARADKAPLLTAKLDLSPALAQRAAALTPPARLFPEAGLAAALALRLPAAPARIVTDDIAILAELRAVFARTEIVRRDAEAWPVNLDAAFDAALSPSLALPGGGAVHFAETRTAAVIDVDTGTPETGSSARAALAANRAAAQAIARQLRLRNIGGPVVIDFVGLSGSGGRRDHRERVRQALVAALEADPAQPQVLGWTRLGHVELVRRRRGRSLADAMLEPGGLISGGPAKQPLALAHEALRLVQREARATPSASWRLSVSPSVAAALRGPAAAALQALETRLGRRLLIAAEAGREGFDIAAI